MESSQSVGVLGCQPMSNDDPVLMEIGSQKSSEDFEIEAFTDDYEPMDVVDPKTLMKPSQPETVRNFIDLIVCIQCQNQ